MHGDPDPIADTGDNQPMPFDKVNDEAPVDAEPFVPPEPAPKNDEAVEVLTPDA